MRVATITVPAHEAELAADRLWLAGARAVEERRAGEGAVELRTTLGNDDGEARARLGPLPASWILEFIEQDERPAETWREFVHAIRINERLVIQPAWLAPAALTGDTLTVGIEPGASFGLGDHPSTRLAASAVDELVCPGDRVLDVGCGSGVLSVIAALRGARSVVAIDIADAAREATVDNARRNGVVDVVSPSTTAIEDIDTSFDLVVANILAPTLVQMAGSLRRVTGPAGRLIVSGVLSGGYAHVAEALQPMDVIAAADLDGWSAVTFAHHER